MNDFSKKTMAILAKRGIRLIGLTYLPGLGDLPWATGETGYVLDDRGTQRVRDFRGVLALAAGA